MGLVISALVTFWVGFLIYKKYKPQPVLFLGGMILMYIAAIFGYGTILPAKAATGSTFFDAFEFIRATMSSNAGKLGMNIMAVGAFARYMDKIGASRSLVRLTIRPLLALKSPYIVLSGTWVVGMLIGLCINSASGLAMLLMVTMFPILIGLGVSRLSATAAVATTLCFDWSPSDTGTILSAETAGLNPVVYWTDYTRYRSFWLPSLLSAHCTISLKNIWINATDMSSSRWKLKNRLKMIRLTARRSGMRSCRLFRWL